MSVASRGRLGVSVYGPAPGEWVSGLPVFQRRFTALLESRGVDVVPFYFTHAPIPPATPDRAFFLPVRERRFYLAEEAEAFGLDHPARLGRFRDELLRFFETERLDALYVVEWSSVGMALWEAALASGLPVAFTPTEHVSVCHLAFLLHPCGEACAGPQGGTKCGRCTHGIEPYPPPRGLARPWYSERHRLFQRAAAWAPAPLRKPAISALASLLQRPGTALSAAAAQARVASARRFLSSAIVAYQSPSQHRTFERALDASLSAPLPLVMPVPPLTGGGTKDVDGRSRPVTFLFAARPDFDRGLWLLLEAWSRWAPPAREARLLVHTHAGGTRFLPEMQRLRARGCDVQLHVGVFTPERLREVHAKAHFVVNPAVWAEPGSASVLEGMFLGTPSVVPTDTGSADFVTPGRSGYHYRFRDVHDLARTLATAVREMDRWHALREAALEAGAWYLRESDRHVDQLCERLFRA